MIHVDTSFLIRALAEGTPEDKRLRRWLARGEALGMSTVALTELLCGPVDPEGLELVSQVVRARVGFQEADATLAARLFNESGRRRGSLADCMMAATAIGARAPLATDNTRDFRRFAPAGLTLAED